MRCLKRSLSGFLFFFLTVSSLFSEYNNNISLELFKYFSDKNLSFVVQHSEKSQSEQFPFNIILPGPEVHEDETPVYFIFKDTDALHNLYAVSLLTSAGTVVLCSGMSPALPESVQSEPYEGLRTLLSSIPSNSALIFLSPDDSSALNDIELIPGGNGMISSCELVKSIIQAGKRSSFSVSIQSLLLSFYRLNWVKGSDAVSLCLENGFQAAELHYSDNLSAERLVNYARALNDEIQSVSFSSGYQYSIINTGSRVITISERIYTSVLFLILLISLSGVCLFSFMFGKHKVENRIIFIKRWYLGPLSVFLAFALTSAAQAIIISSGGSPILHPALALSVKAAFVITGFLSVCLFRYLIPYKGTNYLYAFFMTLAAAFNVFIFTSVDMPFLLPFSLLYLIILASRTIKKWWINLIILILTAFPPVYALVKAIPHLTEQTALSFTSSTHLFNFFMGLFLLPYILMIVRIFIGTGMWTRKTKKHIIIETSVFAAILIFLTILSISIFRNNDALYEQSISHDDYILISDSRESSLMIQTRGAFENGMFSFELTLSDDNPVLRYDISASSSSGIPLYHANLPFTLEEGPGKALFTLDEYPCNPFVVSGIASSSLPLEFEIDAWIKKDASLYLEKHYVVFEEENTGKNHTVRTIIK